ncbi:MAG: gamma-glutamyl-gamma-aminobutyrate hydrolase family protein [Bryobacterales bacterium]|nr:gamma-glutamyl-gamma-aminobutyrate hydrolase family protein [Bryobacterales bacterium]
MRVLAFRHVPSDHLGWIAPALEARGVAFEYIDLFREPEAPIDSGAAAGLVLMRGPMSANHELAYIRRELRLIERAAAGGTPVLGVCLGAQLVAKALGARVYRNPVKEVGWFPVAWTEAARHDTLLAGLSGEDTVFHWHGETFDLPAGSELLASSRACRNQAFRWGESVYGFQFHLEATPRMISDWVRQGLSGGDAGEMGALPDPQANAARLGELATQVFGRWASLVVEKHR